MTPGPGANKFPKSARILKSEDFGSVLRAQGSIRLGRDSVSVCAQAHRQAGLVRFGFTVGKKNVRRSVDRALVKRVMRECARVILPQIRDVCVKQGLGLDISLRYRTPLLVRGDITVAQAKDNVRRSTELAIAALFKRLKTIKLDSEVNP
jgi:ribonuclease P protein component